MIATIDDIPVFNAELGINEGMLCVSLVDCPAVQSDFLRFAKDSKPQIFAVEDEDKRRVLGVVMRADYPIYRYDDKHGEYYMVFRADTIRQMAQQYLADHYQNIVSVDHNGQPIKGVQMVQWFIKDSEKGITPSGFDNIADGSLFAEYQISNEQIWTEIKNGTYKGFSLEGFFSLMPEKNQDKADEMAEIYAGNFRTEINKLKKQIETMGNGRFKRFKESLNAAIENVIAKFGSITTDKGVIVWDDDDELEVGKKVLIDKDGEQIQPEDGEYITPEGLVIVISNGEVSELREPQEPAEPNAPAEPVANEGESAPAEPSEPAEPTEPQNEPYEELVGRINGLESRLSEWETKLQSFEDRIAVLEGKPADDPAEEKYKKAAKEDDGMSRALALARAFRK